MIYKNPEEVLVCNVDELQLLGMHNYENVYGGCCDGSSIWCADGYYPQSDPCI